MTEEEKAAQKAKPVATTPIPGTPWYVCSLCSQIHCVEKAVTNHFDFVGKEMVKCIKFPEVELNFKEILFIIRKTSLKLLLALLYIVY